MDLIEKKRCITFSGTELSGEGDYETEGNIGPIRRRGDERHTPDARIGPVRPAWTRFPGNKGRRKAPAEAGAFV